MRICIITVREDSERLPGKSRKLLGGQLLSDWTVLAALGVRRIDEIRLLSDDEEVLHHWSNEFPQDRIRVIEEPKELATNPKHIEAIIWGLKQGREMRSKEDDIILLQPTNPYRTIEDINYFIDVYAPPYNVCAVDPSWKVCGAIYIIKFKDLLNHRSFNTPLTRYIPLPYPNYLDINTASDWLEAEEVFRQFE